MDFVQNIRGKLRRKLVVFACGSNPEESHDQEQTQPYALFFVSLERESVSGLGFFLFHHPYF